MPVWGAGNNDHIIGKAGFSTQKESRAKILSNLEEAVRNKRYEMNSLRAYDEFKTFVWINNRPMAMKDHHDDIVMSTAIAFQSYKINKLKGIGFTLRWQQNKT